MHSARTRGATFYSCCQVVSVNLCDRVPRLPQSGRRRCTCHFARCCGFPRSAEQRYGCAPFFDGDCSGPDWGRMTLVVSASPRLSMKSSAASLGVPLSQLIRWLMVHAATVTVVGPLPPPSDSNPVCSQRTAELTRLMQFCVARSLSTGFDPNIVAPAGYQMRCDGHR